MTLNESDIQKEKKGVRGRDSRVLSMPGHEFSGDFGIPFSLPANLEVETRRSPMLEKSSLSDVELRTLLRNRLKPFSALLREGGRALFVFDDTTRPTPCDRLPLLLIEEMEKSGRWESIVGLVACGAHVAPSRQELVSKFGHELLGRIQVFPHNPYLESESVGVAGGLRLALNCELARADFVVSFGAFMPHVSAGFSGGGKALLPGLAAMASIRDFHEFIETVPREKKGAGCVDGNPVRVLLQEVAAKAGLSLVIVPFLNAQRQIADCEVVDPGPGFLELCRRRAQELCCPKSRRLPVVIAGCYPRSGQEFYAMAVASHHLEEGGTAVIVQQSPGHYQPHQLLGRWGSDSGGLLWGCRKSNPDPVPGAGRVLIYAPTAPPYYGEKYSGRKVCVLGSWREIYRQLEMLPYGTPAAVLPEAGLLLR